MIDHEHWLEAQKEEEDWWGNCANTYWEEHKQIVYANYMGLPFYEDQHSPYNINTKEAVIFDIGGGPCSLLLKATWKGEGYGLVIDPCNYPDWVRHRYRSKRIWLASIKGEDLDVEAVANEVWMYNCLQHTEDPAEIIQNGVNALVDGGTFRVFEWVDTKINNAHPHSLNKAQLDEWFDREGSTVVLGSEGCYGTAYYGVFTY